MKGHLNVYDDFNLKEHLRRGMKSHSFLYRCKISIARFGLDCKQTCKRTYLQNGMMLWTYTLYYCGDVTNHYYITF